MLGLPEVTMLFLVKNASAVSPPRLPRRGRTLCCAALWILASITVNAASAVTDDDFPEFDDVPGLREFEHPEWFKLSFLNLPLDLKEAAAAGKRGLMVYFGQAHCAYCEALLQVNFGDEEIVAYTRKHFDVIPVDIWSDREVVTMDWRVISEKDYALSQGTNFTPTIVFFDDRGKVVFRLRGYYPPYQFRAALEYVADRHYRRMTFREYLAGGDPDLAFEEGGLIEEDFFMSPPYVLARDRIPGQKPLAVFFEQGNCHACDVLHTKPLSEPSIQKMLQEFEVAQVNMWSDTPVLTPDGRRTTARRWAADLGLFFAPSVVFFDERGDEILRLDSVARFFRLSRVLTYVLTGAYRRVDGFQRWRREALTHVE